MGSEHLVSLNWDQPLPSAVVALTLRPRLLTIIAPRSAEAAANRLRGVVERRGIDAVVRLGGEATDLDAGRPGERMRDVIEEALAPGAPVILDYTGGSKLMAAASRLALGPDASAPAVYLDVRTGVLRWDNGREEPSNPALDLVEIGALHGAGILGAGGTELSDLQDREAVGQDLPRIIQAFRTNRRHVFWKEVGELAENARKGKSGPSDRLAAVVEEILGLRAYMLPLLSGKQGDWLEIAVANAVDRTLEEHAVEGIVRVGVEGRLGQTDLEHVGVRKAHPAVRAVIRTLRRFSTGEGGAQEVRDAVDDLLHEPDDAATTEFRETDFEIDVVVLLGHRVHAISCYAGAEADSVEWKSREIARRAVQLGGDHARAGFVCLLDRHGCEALEVRLRSELPGGHPVAVFGIDDLAAWSASPECNRLAGFLGLTRTGAPDSATVMAEDLDHDMLVTVGGTPVPVLQAILARRASRPLLLHSPPTAPVAQRVAEALARRGVDSVRVEAPDAFRAAAIDAVIGQLPQSEALDITGGTKVLSSRALLRHVGHRDLASVSYVDGRHGAVRSLARGAPAYPLPDDVTFAEFTALRGWRIEASRACSRSSIRPSAPTSPSRHCRPTTSSTVSAP